jgi:hypothetical protein
VHGAVAVEARVALDLETELIEIVPVAGRKEIAGLIEQSEFEVARRAFVARQENLLLQCAGAHVAGFRVDRHLVALNNFHNGYILLPSPARGDGVLARRAVSIEIQSVRSMPKVPGKTRVIQAGVAARLKTSA